MEMHQVRYFLAVCEKLNFSRAAEACHVSQPSLTRAIKLLEHEFGGELLRRERANTHLTSLGLLIRPYLQEVCDNVLAAKQLALQVHSMEKAVLRLGVMCTLAPANLIDLLTGVRQHHPMIQMEIVDSPALDLQDMLSEGKIDAAIYCQPGPHPDDRVHLQPLFREQMYVILPPGHDLAAKDQIRVRDLAGLRYVLRNQCQHNDCIDGFFDNLGVDCPTAYRSDRDDWVLAMVAGGLGFGLIGKHSIGNAVNVVARPLADPELWRVVNLVTMRGRPHSPATGALVHEAMRAKWAGEVALSVLQSLDQRDKSTAA